MIGLGFDRSRSRGGSGEALPQRIEALAAAVELAHGRLDEERVAFGRHVIDKAEARLRHGTAHTLVAMLGATGSGKSSLTNALVGTDIATTGVRRPTTSSTLGCFWGHEDAQPLLDWLDVKNRHHVVDGDVGLDGLVLLDVPDHDSVAVSHRLEMERIAEHADLLLWVTDAEKYADKAMHEYLRRLSGHGAVTAMILNKIDQLGPDDIASCRTDLVRLLADDGLDDSPVFAVSTLTGEGIEQVTDLLVEAVTKQQAVVERLLADLTMAAAGLHREIEAPGRGGGDGAGGVPDKVARTLSRELVGASGLTVVSAAVEAGHRRDAAARTGWPFTRWVRRLRPHPLGKFHLGRGTGGRTSLPEVSGVQLARSEGAVREAAASAAEGLPQPWPDLVRAAGSPDQKVLNDRLDNAISDSVRSGRGRSPRWWSAAGALQVGLALAAVVGAVWLGLLAFGAYLRLPEVPTPEYRGIPIPTGLLIGGVGLGLLVAFISARLAPVGARRRSRAVRSRAEKAVAEVANELVIQPIGAELARRQELRQLLVTAGAEP